MTTENENLIRGAYEAFARGDLAAMLAVVDPDLEWTYLDPAFPNPDPQTCHGRDQLAEGLRRQARRGLKSHVEEVIGNEDKVLVTIRTPGADQFRARQTGDLNYDVFTVRDGRIIALRACRDRGQALAVLGLPEPAPS
ncbi:MAG TPA: nuclear transport factor 2 family protein [Streptosporangiaceae bacterium]